MKIKEDQVKFDMGEKHFKIGIDFTFGFMSSISASWLESLE